MEAARAISGYTYRNADLNQSHGYLLPKVAEILEQAQNPTRPTRIFDLGCGNGSVDYHLTQLGYDVTGVDPSGEGLAKARDHYPNLKLYPGSAYDPLAETYGQFDIVVSLEVVEHVYNPRLYARTLFDLVEVGGAAIVSTPYHSYLKNLALAASGKMEGHFTALWDHGHIKFWSVQTLRTLLEEAGFARIEFHRVGRVPVLAKSMIAVARKTGAQASTGA